MKELPAPGHQFGVMEGRELVIHWCKTYTGDIYIRAECGLEFREDKIEDPEGGGRPKRLCDGYRRVLQEDMCKTRGRGRHDLRQVRERAAPAVQHEVL